MVSRQGEKWSREETILAYDLYCRTPFAKIHKSNKDIIALAELIGRTPSSRLLGLYPFHRQYTELVWRGGCILQMEEPV